MINRLFANVKLNQLFMCVDCKRSAIGETKHVEINCLSTNELKEELDAIRQSSHQMPVGWSYDGEFHCGCNRK